MDKKEKDFKQHVEKEEEVVAETSDNQKAEQATEENTENKNPETGEKDVVKELENVQEQLEQQKDKFLRAFRRI